MVEVGIGESRRSDFWRCVNGMVVWFWSGKSRYTGEGRIVVGLELDWVLFGGRLAERFVDPISELHGYSRLLLG